MILGKKCVMRGDEAVLATGVSSTRLCSHTVRMLIQVARMSQA